MAADPDYRSDKMNSLEGLGIARARWSAFHDAVPDDAWEEIYAVEHRTSAGARVVDIPEDDLDVPTEVLLELAADVVEQSDLLGFYLAWHLAGGFANLQRAGWHRATIHRKIRRFRSRFGKHPDELFFPWMRLDLDKVWRKRLIERMHPAEEPDW